MWFGMLAVPTKKIIMSIMLLIRTAPIIITMTRIAIPVRYGQVHRSAHLNSQPQHVNVVQHVVESFLSDISLLVLRIE